MSSSKVLDAKYFTSGGMVTDIASLIGIREEKEGVEASFLIVSDDETEEEGTHRPADLEDTRRHSCSFEDGKWMCRPYKREVLLQEILQANKKGEDGHAAVLTTLKNNGVRIFVIDSKASSTVCEIMDSIHSVISHVTKLDRNRPILYSKSAKRCLLFRDHEGRFFNLTLSGYTTASESTFNSLLDTFSGFQAMCALLILCRAFACATEPDKVSGKFQSAYLGLLLGLVFVEEISYSWVNVAMFVRGMPSISAYAATTKVASDWLRKVLVFALTLGSVTSGQMQVLFTLFGISLACAVILANLGARAWAFLQWKPLAYTGPLDPLVSYIAAVLTGALLPYLGHRQIEVGGKAAMESVLRVALLVAIIFVISDYDGFQKFLVIGSENCNQDVVNIVVGCWWTISLIFSLQLVRTIEPAPIFPHEEESLLEEDQSSPLGFKVPNLPDFSINPNRALKGVLPGSVDTEFVLGIIMALAVGAGIVALGFTDFDEMVAKNVEDFF